MTTLVRLTPALIGWATGVGAALFLIALAGAAGFFVPWVLTVVSILLGSAGFWIGRSFRPVQELPYSGLAAVLLAELAIGVTLLLAASFAAGVSLGYLLWR